jgi:nitroreductase
MDAFDRIITKLDVREYDPSKSVPSDVKIKVLEAARSTGTGMNSQHWRFILLDERGSLKQLATDSTTGKWVESCNFAVIVLTNPKLGYHIIDAGRVVQNMQVAAWNYGVVSRVFTGLNPESLRRDFGIPQELNPTIVVGFGFPLKKITGKRKNRMPLEELVFLGRYGNKFDRSKVG